MYLNYWNLKSQPFSNVPEPTMYVTLKDHTDPVSEILFSLENDEENLLVLTGPEGTGKTTCLRRIVESLDTSRYAIAFVTNPATSFALLLREVLSQLEHRIYPMQTASHYEASLSKVIDDNSRSGRRVLIFIDDYSAISIPDIDALQSLIRNIGTVSANFSFVIAGRPELGKRLEEPSSRELFQMIGTYCKTSVIDSLEGLRKYLSERMARVGGRIENVFVQEAIDVIWANPANRTSRAVNSICRLCLKRAAEKHARVIDAKLVREIADHLSSDPLSSIPPQQPLQSVKAIPPKIVEIVPSNEELPRASGLCLIERTQLDDAKERLANQLASDRIRHLDNNMLDPFEAWSSARNEILTTLERMKTRQAV